MNDLSTFYYLSFKYNPFFRIFALNTTAIMLELINSLTTIELIIWILFLFLVLFQLFYQFISYRKLLFYNVNTELKEKKSSLPPVSIIICAKNEATNLEQYLPRFLEQDYPEFQVIVVNDCSDDRSADVLEELSKHHDHLYFTNIKSDPIYRHGKKLAVTLGIKAAKYEHLVFTDADCFPTSKDWLYTMANNFSDEKKLIIGVSPYTTNKGLLGQVIGYETLQTAVSYISSALRQNTYMGVGRNMAYTKSLFYDNKGFSGHTHILSGDDDLFINKAANKTNVAVEISDQSVVKSLPAQYWSEWFKQKRRHLSTGQFYKTRHKLRFTIEGAQGFLFYCTFIILLAFNSYPLIVATLFLIRMLTTSTYRTIAAKKMNFEMFCL